MLHRPRRTGATVILVVCCGWVCAEAVAQDAPPVTQLAPASSNTPASGNAMQAMPDAPKPLMLQQRTPKTPEEKEAARIAALGKINGRPYDQPSNKDQFFDYLRDSYGWSAFARSTVRSLYEEGLDKPSDWGQGFKGFSQRMGSNAAITAIDGTVRYGMETLFHEDMKYIPCHGCSVRKKIQNALLSEVTARHDVDGHRFFTLTPAIADFSGPIIANYLWYPNHDPFGGVVATRTVAATRIGQHLFREFVWERRHHDPKLRDDEIRMPAKPQPQP